MDTARFDQVTKSLVEVSSRRWVIGAIFGGVLGLSRSREAGATHRPGHHCTPSHNHPCPDGQTCREVGGTRTCEVFCQVLQEACTTDTDCCPPLCCDNPTGTRGVCDTDCFD